MPQNKNKTENLLLILVTALTLLYVLFAPSNNQSIRKDEIYDCSFIQEGINMNQVCNISATKEKRIKDMIETQKEINNQTQKLDTIIKELKQ